MLQTLQLRLRIVLGATCVALCALLFFSPAHRAADPCPPPPKTHPSTHADTYCSFDGTIIPDGTHIDLYRTPTVPFGERCAFESRYCRRGVLTGGYFNFRSCYVESGM